MNRSKHSLSHYNLTTCDMGQIIPIAMIPVLPGDMIGHHTNALVRVSPLAAPVMHQVDVRVHHFYSANRTLWPDADRVDGNDWESFITGGEDGMNTDTIPTLDPTGAVAGGLLDYFGIPVGTTTPINSLPIIAFNRIFNEFYRDQDLVPKRDDLDLTIPRCAWEKDYLSCSRPWAQKGPQISIPIGASSPIGFNGATSDVINIQGPGGSADLRALNTAAATATLNVGPGGLNGELFADLANATGADPIDVRTAWGLQRWAENAARFGNRYPEKMRQLGSTYKGLMDRPLYLGGGSQSVNFSEVLQTSNGADPRFGVGDLYGHGIAAMRSNKYAHKAQEHGCIISCLSVRPKTIYQEGLHREWLKQDREDFHDPYLEFVGQQEVWNAEALSTHPDPLGTFGYSDKYQEYRGHDSKVSGEFRDLLDYWHLARQYDAETPPVLNQSFIDCVPSKRVFNEQTQHSLWVMAHHKIAAHRNVTRSATPRLL